MQKIIQALFLLYFSFSLQAQQITKTFKIGAGEDISAALSIYGVYKFPGFIYGIVLFKDGTNTKAKMNFNVFLNDMQFIDNKGDTLAINQPELIDSIKLDSNIFYFDKGYCEIITDYINAKLIKKEKINYEIVKKGAYDLPARGASIETYGLSGINYNPAKTLTLNQDIIIKKETSYLVSYKKYRTVRANEKGFLSAFPDIKKEVMDFIETNKTDFTKEEDIKKLLKFCSEHI
jgi:hypothetical protein